MYQKTWKSTQDQAATARSKRLGREALAIGVVFLIALTVYILTK